MINKEEKKMIRSNISILLLLNIKKVDIFSGVLLLEDIFFSYYLNNKKITFKQYKRYKSLLERIKNNELCIISFKG